MQPDVAHPLELRVNYVITTLKLRHLDVNFQPMSEAYSLGMGFTF